MLATEKAKKTILDFMRENSAREGHSFNAKAFFHRKMMNMSPPEQDAVEPAADALVEAGYFEKRQDQYYLTKAGYEHLYA